MVRRLFNFLECPGWPWDSFPRPSLEVFRCPLSVMVKYNQFERTDFCHLFVIGLQQRAAGKKVQYVLPSGTLASSWCDCFLKMPIAKHTFWLLLIFCRFFILVEEPWIFLFALAWKSSDYHAGPLPRTVSFKAELPWKYLDVLCNEKKPARRLNLFCLLVYLLQTETFCKMWGI